MDDKTWNPDRVASFSYCRNVTSYSHVKTSWHEVSRRSFPLCFRTLVNLSCEIIALLENYSDPKKFIIKTNERCLFEVDCMPRSADAFIIETKRLANAYPRLNNTSLLLICKRVSAALYLDHTLVIKGWSWETLKMQVAVVGKIGHILRYHRYGALKVL